MVAFLNRLMTLQVDVISSHRGDVDKMIGDAVLARFDGEDGTARALDAARQMLRRIKQDDFPRDIGIGLYRGDVIAGAKAGEIVADAQLADDAFSGPETITVKGRQQPLAIRR